MKTKRFLLVTLTLFSLTFFAQEKTKQETKASTIIVKNGEVKTNQFVLDYLSTETKIKNNTIKQTIRNKQRIHNNKFGRPLLNNDLTPYTSKNETTIIIDNELAIGEKANNFHLLDNVKMKDVEKITVTEIGLGCIIYITKS